ncbi:MAG TPA: indole-3-glycerol-phosphate synthase [Gemmatimonadaceae bacterium]|nr:indole-3-glycerol-phosphate synthase [Gemmatimonadaceae bacterium]
MQAQSVEVTAGGALRRLVAAARQRVAAKLVPLQGELSTAVRRAPKVPPFRKALLEGIDVGVIAEIKRRSPSQGILREDLDVARRARDYEQGGAAALSILTEETEFAGSMTDLAIARSSVGLPLLKKDFHVHPLQLYEARVAGASAVLLIARALGSIGLKTMLNECRDLGLEALVEVHSSPELLWALDLGAECIGVNARDLETLTVDREVVQNLIPRIPGTVCAIAESGIAARVDVERAARVGADSVLVGSALSRAADPVMAVRDLTGVIRRERGELDAG